MTETEFLCALTAGVVVGALVVNRFRATPAENDAGASSESSVQVDRVPHLRKLLGAVVENAAIRWPDIHRDDAIERFALDLRLMNSYHRDQARKKEVAIKEVTTTERPG